MIQEFLKVFVIRVNWPLESVIKGRRLFGSSCFIFETIDIKIHTRGQACECLICDIGRLKLTEKHPLERTKTGEKTSDRRCSTSLSLIGRGLPHHCSSSQFRKNLRELAKSDGVVAEQVASSTIVSKKSSPCGTIRLVQPKGGGLLPITQGPSCSKQLFKDPAVVTAKDLAQVQLNTGKKWNKKTDFHH
ncbi:uncharacterized protein LOC124816450 [Hydra vulgaris]|uniref:uncharacterized protein LOC124816450 n=1 Tax=Hydra vulgaris TaxID=6087 RepID=UPI001F5F38E3|nr:uncharacterized protein LOC124816450 [Hydra vulgaris]